MELSEGNVLRQQYCYNPMLTGEKTKGRTLQSKGRFGFDKDGSCGGIRARFRVGS